MALASGIVRGCGLVAELVDAVDSKSTGLAHLGSTPSEATSFPGSPRAGVRSRRAPAGLRSSGTSKFPADCMQIINEGRATYWRKALKISFNGGPKPRS
jgi:hypothetical protein